MKGVCHPLLTILSESVFDSNLQSVLDAKGNLS